MNKIGFAIQRSWLYGAVACGLLITLPWRIEAVAKGRNFQEALALAMQSQGVDLVGQSARSLEKNLVLGTHSLAVLGRPKGEPADVFLVTLRTGAGSKRVKILELANISRSPSADEIELQIHDHLLTYAARVGNRIDSMVLVDTRGESSAVTQGWSRMARLQNCIQNLQETGRCSGLGVTRYQLQVPVETIDIKAHHPSGFTASFGQRQLVIDGMSSQPIQGKEWVETTPHFKGAPGGITWLVDTVRRVPWVGAGPIEWLEHYVFALKDRIERLVFAVIQKDTASEAAQELGVSRMTTSAGHNAVQTQDESKDDSPTDWPPSPLQPMLSPPVQGEGRWIVIENDPFLASQPHAPPAFVQTFIRADPEREFTRVYVTMWDPRQVQLNLVMGTQEPESATGFTGSGTIPRDPATVNHLVAGFNGGFQALHGEYGMMADGYVFLPPKPWAATLAVMEDGQVGVGSWPAPPTGKKEYDEEWATEQIPPGMVAMRQNLTSVVEDGQINPWERWWWGAAPPGAGEQTYTHRSGLCVTKEGFMAYFWGTSMGPEALGSAMNASRCTRGMHLDMNSGHCGMEFYKTTMGKPESLGRPLTDDEFEGPMPYVDGVTVRIRKAIKSMSMIRFPRYTKRDPRDYFYLTLKPVLPGPNAELGSAQHTGNEGRFTSAGLPSIGWPPPFARTTLGSPGSRTHVLRIDTSRAIPTPLRRSDHQRVLAFVADSAQHPSTTGQMALYAVRHPIGWRLAVGVAPRDAKVLFSGSLLSSDSKTHQAVGVDTEGFLVFAQQEGDAHLLGSRLEAVGVLQALAIEDRSQIRLLKDDEHTIGIDREPIHGAQPPARERMLEFFAEERPRTQVLFPDTKPSPYRVWGFLQGRRVRYFPSAPPRFTGPGSN